MSDLVEKLRGLFTIEDLARSAGVDLKSQGGHRAVGCCPFHTEKTPSFNLFLSENRFKCFGCGKGGDVFDFIALWKLGMERPAGDDFKHLLRVACELANLNYDEEVGRTFDSKRVENNRRMGNILTAFAQCAETCWSPTMLARTHAAKPNGAGKAYLTPDAIKRWNLGIAPNIHQLKEFGISDDDLRFAGLMRNGQHGDFLLFRDALIIPHMKAGRCVYMAGRVYKYDAKCRYINLPLPLKDGTGGVENPAIFNAEAFWSPKARTEGVLMVEGRLDAIACCEIGHPAVAYISTPTPKFIDEARRYQNVKLYYAPDCTKDMTSEKRATAAASIGPDVLCCTLPDGLDPDECSSAQLTEAKARAHDTVDEWLKMLAA